MAQSDSHKFGQLIGNFVESVIIEVLEPVAQKYNLYLDYRHPREARNGRTEVIWSDVNGNKHKLDIVLEENGSETEVGNPKAFIEMAWRRYTKHSKNKVQEISGALLPLVSKYKKNAPFYGAIIAGEFTEPSINQLISEGFQIVYFQMETIRSAFRVVDFDIFWEENTPEEVLAEKVKYFCRLSDNELGVIKDKLIQLNERAMNQFIQTLESCILRKIEYVRIFLMHGCETEVSSIEEAYNFINSYEEFGHCDLPIIKYEIYMRYNNGDKIEVHFSEKRDALNFLREYETIS